MKVVFCFILITSLFKTNLIFSQDVINPYILYDQIPQNNIPDYPSDINIGNPTYVNTDQMSNITYVGNPYYWGEYEIAMDYHYWYNFINTSLPINQCTSPNTLGFSYEYELVSFPFVNECAFQNNVCASLPDRQLYMPIENSQHFTYDPNNNCWNFFNWQTPMFNKTGKTGFLVCNFSSGNNSGTANTLVSAGFVGTGLGGTNGATTSRRGIPHSVIKHTVYAHCSYPPSSGNITSQFSWYYDNTRGQMRYYPFSSANVSNSAMEVYDVIFTPMLIKNQYEINNPSSGNPLGYDELVYDEHMVMPDGSINYYKYGEINPTAACTSTYAIPTEVGSEFIEWTPIEPAPSFYYPSYSYTTAPLKSYHAEYLAGYKLNTTTGQIELRPGMEQNYFIDQNTDLTRVNPTDRIIYNPSEATITANDFIFPQDYTFKTIRGVYPTVADVNEAKIQENGYPNCTSCDLRLIPVRTDLTTESATDATDFPLSTQALTQHLYASRYYLDNTQNTYPKLTIENCVGLYDCTFDVRDGSTMLFTDYPAHYGIEDNSYTNAGNSRVKNRFKIQTLGGAVLRNLAPIQYLQNGNIIQPTPLHYTATQEIHAGGYYTDSDDDINDLSVNHDYVVQSGADVTLEANNTIYLKDGFSTLSGSTFTAKIATTTLSSAGQCPDLTVNLRLAGTEKDTKKKRIVQGLQAFPNPTTGILKLHNNNKPILAQALTITDAFGRTVFEKTNFNSIHDVIDFSTQPNGVYVAKVVNEGESKPLRFVVNH